jgi:protein-disulfide isomerase
MPSTSQSRFLRPQWLILFAAVIAIIVVVIAAALSSGSAPKRPSAAAAGVPTTAAAQFKGIPEHNGVLGATTAPVTLTEFIDLQCPICRQAAADDWPMLVNNYVRTGRMKLRVRILQFIGKDSVTAARYAAGAKRQNRLWPFIATFYAVQGTENSGYVTPAFLRSVAKASGVDDAKASAFASTAAAGQALNAANAQAQHFGVNATPTFVLQRGNGPQHVLGTGLPVEAQFRALLDEAVAK